MIEMRGFNGLIRNQIDSKEAESCRSLLATNLEFIATNTYQEAQSLNFDAFFTNVDADTIFLFPYQSELYVIIQRQWHFLEEQGILKWNEVNPFGQFIEHAENMIEQITTGELFQVIQLYFTHDFHLYQIPFYFISHIREIYIPTDYGERKGKWEIRIHPFVELPKNILSFPMTRKFTLRKYQANAIMEWNKNQRFGTIALATAGGKTIIGLETIYQTNVPTLIAVPTIPLVQQWREEVHKYLDIPLNQIGQFYGQRKQFKPILIGTYHSLEKYMNFDQKARAEIEKRKWTDERKALECSKREKYASFLNSYYALLILDESHHIPAPLFRHIALQSQALMRISLSATVERFDKNETLLYFASGQKIFELNYLDLCEEGWVVPFFYHYLPVPMTEEEVSQYQSLGPNKHAKKVLTYYNDRKLSLLTQIVQLHVREHHQILIFNSFVKSCLDIYNHLRGLNIPVGLILSKKNQKKGCDETRESAIDQFKTQKLAVLISTTVLDEGFNVPECTVGIILNGGSSDRQLIQRVGRIVRKSPTDPFKIAYIYEITTESSELMTVDYVNHLLRNRMIESLELYNETQEFEPRSCWTFDYELITGYAEKKAKNLKLPIFEISP